MISREDANDPNILKIKAFCDHLGAYQDIQLPFFKRGNDPGMSMLSLDGIKVHSANSGLGQIDF